MIDFWDLLSRLRKRTHRPHTATRVSRGKRTTSDRRQFVAALVGSGAARTRPQRSKDACLCPTETREITFAWVCIRHIDCSQGRTKRSL